MRAGLFLLSALLSSFTLAKVDFLVNPLAIRQAPTPTPTQTTQPILTGTTSSIPTCELNGASYSISWDDNDSTVWIGATSSKTPISTTNKSATPTSVAPATPTFPSCTTIPTPMDPQYPCQCGQFTYCSNNGQCNWTSEPPAEDCCLDCM